MPDRVSAGQRGAIRAGKLQAERIDSSLVGLQWNPVDIVYDHTIDEGGKDTVEFIRASLRLDGQILRFPAGQYLVGNLVDQDQHPLHPVIWTVERDVIHIPIGPFAARPHRSLGFADAHHPAGAIHFLQHPQRAFGHSVGKDFVDGAPHHRRVRYAGDGLISGVDQFIAMLRPAHDGNADRNRFYKMLQKPALGAVLDQQSLALLSGTYMLRHILQRKDKPLYLTGPILDR